MAESRESRVEGEREMGIIVPLKFQTFCPIISHLIVTAERTAPSPLCSWLPDCYSHIFKSYVFGPSGFLTMAPLHYTAMAYRRLRSYLVF